MLGTDDPVHTSEKDAITEFRVLFDTIAGLSMDPLHITPQNIVEHFCAIGLIRAHDGTQHDFARTLAKFTKKFDAKGKLERAGHFNEDEFVKFWFNTHKFYNKYDVNNSGAITRADFLQSLKDTSNSEMDTDEKVSEIFNIADRNRDGVIDFIEFFCRLPQILNWA